MILDVFDFFRIIPQKYGIISMLLVITAVFINYLTDSEINDTQIKWNNFMIELNNATDMKRMIDLYLNIEKSLDRDFIINLMDEDKDNIHDVLKMAWAGTAGAGFIFAGVTNELKKVLIAREADPDLFDQMSPDEIEKLVAGLVYYNPQTLNVTVKRNGVVDMRSQQRGAEFRKRMDKEATEKQAICYAVRTMAPDLRQIFLARQDADYLYKLSERTGLVGWLHSFVAATPTYNLVIVLKSVVSYLRTTREIFRPQALSLNQSLDYFWITNIFTGYGLALAPLLFILFITIGFFSEDSIILVVMEQLIPNNGRLTNFWKLSFRSTKNIVFICFRYLIPVFIASNIFFVAGSWAIYILFPSFIINDAVNKFIISRVNILYIMSNEFSTDQIWHGLIMTMVLLLDNFGSMILKRAITLRDLRYVVQNPHMWAPPATRTERTYYGFLRRYRLYTIFMCLFKSKDFYSLFVKKAICFCFWIFSRTDYRDLFVAFTEVNEVNQFIFWISGVWTGSSSTLQSF